jgi:hypothetical protein
LSGSGGCDERQTHRAAEIIRRREQLIYAALME